MKSAKIWLQYQKEIKRFVSSKVKDKNNTDDILQDVFIKLHSNLNSIQDPAKIRSWLYQVTRNTINDHFRKQKFQINVESIELSAGDENANSNDRFLNCMEPHINKLPAKYKEAITKVELQSYSQLKLAKELNISYSALKSRVQRGRTLLKKYFKACCNVTADKYGNIVASEKKYKCSIC